jgi:hypothetical protein
MSVDWDVIGVPFTGGIDSKQDEKSLPPTKLLTLENGIFTKRGAIRKRHGYTALGPSLSAGKALATLGDELIAMDGEKLYSRSVASAEWVERGDYTSVVTGQETVVKTRSEQLSADAATVGGMTVYAWEDSRGGVRLSLVDAETGAIRRHDVALAGASLPRVVAVGGWIHVYHLNDTAGEFRVLRISPADPATASGAAIAVATDLHATQRIYDVATSGPRVLLAYRFQSGASHGIRLRYITQAGAVVSGEYTNTFDTTWRAIAVAVNEDTGEIALSVSRGSAWSVTFQIFDASLAPATADWNIAETDAQVRVAAGWEAGEISAGVRRAWCWWETSAASTDNHIVGSRPLTTGGTLGDAVALRHSCLASRAFSAPGGPYVHVVRTATLQTTHFLARYDGRVVAKLLPGIAGGRPPTAVLAQVDGHASGLYSWPAIYRERLESVEGSPVYGDKSIKRVTIDFDHAQAYRGVQSGDALYLTGGYLHEYDGAQVVEAGFHLFPEGITAASSSDSGSLVAGKAYSYRCYWEWTNARGEREQSSTAAIISHTVGGGHNTLTLTVPTLAHTSKADVVLAVYRTEADPGDDAPFYRVSSLDPAAVGANGYIKNNTGADTIAFIDKLADATIITRELDYQNTGELDNISAESASVIAAGKDRVFLAGFENPSEIRASKLRYYGTPVAFNDALGIEVDEAGGPVTGLAVMRDLLIVFKRSRIFALQGEGPDNLGAGSWFPPQQVAADVGCVNQRSIVYIPGGLMFQSEKGIYLLSEGLQTQYIGAAVEAYNGQSVTAATLLPDTNAVRFLTSSGMTLHFDYLFGEWSTFTAHEGIDAVLWKGRYVYARSDGEVRVEDPALFTDVGVTYRLRLVTAWIKLVGLQGFQRIRRALVLGEHRSAHKLRCEAGFDYEANLLPVATFDSSETMNLTTWGSGATWGSDALWGGEGSRVYQFRSRLPRQKCQAIRFSFEDLPSENPGESYEITELALEVGLKKGAYKLPASRTIGG